jgi:hypothetical protein
LVGCLVSYGRRSLGDQVRFSPEGPRNLEETDLRSDGKPKVIRNPDSSLITKPVAVRFEPLIEPERQAKLLALLDQRGGTQRGKPRSRNPAENPLGCRVFDMNCAWPMYRQPDGKRFRYTCGLYQQSHGGHCAHNHVDGQTAVRFLLGCLRQRILTPRLLGKLEQRLRDLAGQERSGQGNVEREISAKEKISTEVKSKLERAGMNLALAENRQEYQIIARVIEDLTKQEQAVSAEIAELRRTSSQKVDLDNEVAAAMDLMGCLTDLATDAGNYASLGEAFREVNAQLFLRFAKEQVKSRTLNKLVLKQAKSPAFGAESL